MTSDISHNENITNYIIEIHNESKVNLVSEHQCLMANNERGRLSIFFYFVHISETIKLDVNEL